jgi:Flp pilus assembly protein TadG
MFMRSHNCKKSQRGVAVVEFAMTAAAFFLMLVAVVAGGHFFFTHNALVEATRRGARYAANQCPDQAAFTSCPARTTTLERVRRVVVYDNPNADISTATPFLPNLQTSNVTVTYSTSPAFGVATGTVSVKVENYTYIFMGVSITMPTYQSTLQGESAGFVPADLP